MFRSATQIVCLMFLLVVLAASTPVQIAGTESNSQAENLSSTDTNADDDPESILPSFQVANSESSSFIKSYTKQYCADNRLDSLLSIRAPPRFYL